MDSRSPPSPLITTVTVVCIQQAGALLSVERRKKRNQISKNKTQATIKATGSTLANRRSQQRNKLFRPTLYNKGKAVRNSGQDYRKNKCMKGEGRNKFYLTKVWVKDVTPLKSTRRIKDVVKGSEREPTTDNNEPKPVDDTLLNVSGTPSLFLPYLQMHGVRMSDYACKWKGIKGGRDNMHKFTATFRNDTGITHVAVVPKCIS